MAWTDELHDDLFEAWDQHRAAAPDGFRLFFQPFTKRNGLLVCGLNPGGRAGTRGWPSDADQVTSPARHVPDDHLYFGALANRGFAKRMRGVFGDHEAVLRGSVKANLYPIRTPSSSGLKAIPPALQAAGVEATRRLIERTKPKAVLFEGIGTPSGRNKAVIRTVFGHEFSPSSDEVTSPDGSLWKTGRLSDLPAAAIRHPGDYRGDIFDAHQPSLQAALEGWLRTIGLAR